MPRTGRKAPGGWIYHVFNRGNGRSDLFRKDEDFAAFQNLLFEVREAVPLRILSWCLMSNHWHLVLWPREDGELSSFMLRLSTAHVRRHHAHYRRAGGGHLYQGRFKSFPVQDDHHFLTLCRYVEANPLRAGMVTAADRWRWSSLWAAENAQGKEPAADKWPVPRPRGWARIVNQTMEKEQLDPIRTSLRRGRPLGSVQWVKQTAAALGLDFTLRDRGRPKKSVRESGK